MSEGKRKKILVLNLEISGVNKYLFSQLESRGWTLSIINVPVPKICIILAFIFSFDPDILKWQRKFKQNRGRFAKIPWSFIQRTKMCEKKIKKMKANQDIIFQISGMFSPTTNYEKLKQSYVTFNDYTMALAQKYPEESTTEYHRKKWMMLEKNLYQNAKYIFTPSENTRMSFIYDYDIEPHKVITAGYGPIVKSLPDIAKDYSSKTILFIGKDFHRKGGFVLLKAFEKVLREVPEAKLIIAGVKKEFLRIQQPGVVVYGYAKEKKFIDDLYEKASLYVMPSLCEPFGLVFLEAMAYKLPCIGTNIDAMPEIIEDGETGFLVPPNDSNALAERIILLLQNPDMCKTMGLNAREYLNEKFSWDRLGETIDSYLKQLL